MKVAVVLFAAFEPFGAKETGAGGVPLADQVYVSCASPPSSAPSTLRLLVMPVAGFGLALAAVATVGG